MLLYAVVPADATAPETRGLLRPPARDDPGRARRRHRGGVL